jgi:hypothetical protein
LEALNFDEEFIDVAKEEFRNWLENNFISFMKRHSDMSWEDEMEFSGPKK